jgi:hypothetical protein
MELLIPELNPFDWKPIFTGTQSRNPTVTGVKWLSESRLVTANRQAAKMYLLEETDTELSIIFTLDTVFNGVANHTDLFDISDNIIYATNNTPFVSIYKIIDNTIIFVKNLTLHSSNRYHGVQVHNNKVFFTPSMGTQHIAVYDLSTKAVTYVEPDRIGLLRIKDICFLNSSQVIFCLTTDTPSDHAKYYDGFVALYKWTGSQFKYLQKVSLKDNHLDSVVNKGNKVYVTAHSPKENGQIHVLEVKDNILTLCVSIKCHNFPHGIDIYKKTLAYTSYGTSGVHFLNI